MSALYFYGFDINLYFAIIITTALSAVFLLLFLPNGKIGNKNYYYKLIKLVVKP